MLESLANGHNTSIDIITEDHQLILEFSQHTSSVYVLGLQLMLPCLLFKVAAHTKHFNTILPTFQALLIRMNECM